MNYERFPFVILRNKLYVLRSAKLYTCCQCMCNYEAVFNVSSQKDTDGNNSVRVRRVGDWETRREFMRFVPCRKEDALGLANFLIDALKWMINLKEQSNFPEEIPSPEIGLLIRCIDTNEGSDDPSHMMPYLHRFIEAAGAICMPNLFVAPVEETIMP